MQGWPIVQARTRLPNGYAKGSRRKRRRLNEVEIYALRNALQRAQARLDRDRAQIAMAKAELAERHADLNHAQLMLDQHRIAAGLEARTPVLRRRGKRKSG